jgi:hypothetical protein
MAQTEQDAWVEATFAVDPAKFAKPEPGVLASAWAWTKDEAAAAGHAIGTFDDAHGHVLTRAAGAAQMAGGAAEALAGATLAGVGGAATGTGVGAAPGIPAMVGGTALAFNGADNAQTGLRTLLSGEFHHTALSTAVGAGARSLGASEQSAERITNALDLTQGIAGGAATAAAGLARKAAAAGLPNAAICGPNFWSSSLCSPGVACGGMMNSRSQSLSGCGNGIRFGGLRSGDLAE